MRQKLLCFSLFTLLASVPLCADVIYDSSPSATAQDIPAFSYVGTSSTQFGDQIQFAGTPRDLTTVTAFLSNQAFETLIGETPGTTAGFDATITENLYNVGAGGAVGSLIASRTVTDFLPWRAEPSPNCTGQFFGDYQVGGVCYAGQTTPVAFDFTGVTVPDSIIYGLALDTSKGGALAALSFGLTTSPPSVGSNPAPGSLYLDSTDPSIYHNSGTTGVFRLDPSGWSPYSGAVKFEAVQGSIQPTVPEPSTFVMLGIALLALAFGKRRLTTNPR